MIPILYPTMMIRILALLVSLLATTSSYADELVVDGALGIFNTEGNSISNVKFAKLSVQGDVYRNLKQRFNIGGWADNRNDGHTSSTFTGYQLGFDVENATFDMAVFSGPTLISSTDEDLGGHFQFNETIYLGIRDAHTGSGIGVAYNHFSSAGLEMPNQGKDFMGLEIRFPF